MLAKKVIGATAAAKQQFIAVAHFTSPSITAYPWSASGFGTKFANPATLPASNSNGVALKEI
jgi:hypothetical protein